MATYESDIEIVEGTFGKDVNLQAQDSEGDALALTDGTVTWHVYKAKGTVCALLGTCTAVDLPNGKVKYTLQSSDWGAGKLEGGEEYKSSLVAKKAGYQEEFPNLKVTTIEQAPSS